MKILQVALLVIATTISTTSLASGFKKHNDWVSYDGAHTDGREYAEAATLSQPDKQAILTLWCSPENGNFRFSRWVKLIKAG